MESIYELIKRTLDMESIYELIKRTLDMESIYELIKRTLDMESIYELIKRTLDMESIYELIKRTLDMESIYELIKRTLDMESIYELIKRALDIWVPHSLTEDQKLVRVKWCNFMLKNFDEGKSKPVTKLGFEILIQKQNGNLLFGALQKHLLLRKFAEPEVLEKNGRLFFFRKSGLIDIVKLEDRKTVNSESYTTKCLPAVFEKIKQSRPRAQLRRVLLHHDNARPHTSAQTLDVLANSGIQLVTHPPYSPDLAPCDFFISKS
ncbi:hypothetical protein LAZ67_5003939 [Cordylochernes scorpioides]|uniref:Tc1-like transposase DDE domain-containing protein n=1 Tax=Cordylochernes scorpioides TaxID=51811 RepID=A0ABY6KKQ5_9ARAC|nr:hypothetical protein LAZ67_5003939 [Cordylochernes scorpioides]